MSACILDTLPDGTCTCILCGRVYASKVHPCDMVVLRCRVTPPAHGPGTELEKMAAEQDIFPFSGCGCASLKARMNRWGPQGCRDNMDAIIAGLQANGRKLNPPIDVPEEIARWAVDEAIRRAEKGNP